MLIGTLGASLLENLLTHKGVKWSKVPGRGVMRVGEGTGEGILTIFEIKKHYQNEPKFTGVYLRNNLPKKRY